MSSDKRKVIRMTSLANNQSFNAIKELMKILNSGFLRVPQLSIVATTT